MIFQDSLFITFHMALLATAYTGSWSLAALAGVLLGMNMMVAHNFFHLRDNFRRYYWDASMFNSTEWRISHVLSHHVCANTGK